MKKITFSKTLLHPKYALTWLAMALWWLLIQVLPLTVQIRLGRLLGHLLYRYASSRRRIAEKNLALCFPEKTQEERDIMVKQVLEETGIAIFESGAAWFWPNWRFHGKYTLLGKEHIDAAHAHKQGVLFLGIHFTTIEIGAAIVNLELPISGFYRPHTNAVYEYVQAVGRTRRNKNSSVIPNGDVRGIIKALRGGKTINYAPDQDYGQRRSVFAPFFNIQTATVKAPQQLASAGKAEVIPWVTRRDPQTHSYIIEILPPITDQLGDDDYANAVVINNLIEQQIRLNPLQYLWVHRRFKTRPEGDASVY